MILTQRVGHSALPDTTESTSQLLIQASTGQLPRLEHWVAQLSAQFLLSPPLVHRIDLCLTELVSNVIQYGYPGGKAGTVRIGFWRQPEQIVIRIEDDGSPFDPSSYVPAELPGSLDQATPGGRGIRLVRHFADELHHRRSAATNQLTLVFRTRRTDAPWSVAEAAPEPP
jgi:anti-sigma regulatory factor (Ser/Thr protein kinase)